MLSGGWGPPALPTERRPRAARRLPERAYRYRTDIVSVACKPGQRPPLAMNEADSVGVAGDMVRDRRCLPAWPSVLPPSKWAF
jgi:hypothetical protein